MAMMSKMCIRHVIVYGTNILSKGHYLHVYDIRQCISCQNIFGIMGCEDRLFTFLVL